MILLLALLWVITPKVNLIWYLQKTIWEAVNLANLSKGGNAVAHTIDFQGDTNASKNNILTNASTNELFVAGLG